MADLIGFTGDKGGVGKSFVCRAAVQFCLDRNLPFTVFDTDRSNADVRRIYGTEADCKLGVFSESERHEDKANHIYNAAIERRALVNMPAQVFPALRLWIENNDLLELSREDNVHFVFFFVVDGGYDSSNLLIKSLEYFKDNARHIIVKNYGKADDFEAFEQNEKLQKLIKRHKATTIDFPKFIGSVERNTLDAESLSFGKGLTLEQFGSISRQRIRKFLKEAYAAFEASGVFS